MGVAGSDDIEVRADPAFAAAATQLRVVFRDTRSFGRHMELRSSTQTIATFPWFDHADQRLAASPDGWAPLADDDARVWDDLDQGWCLRTIRQSGAVFVFEADFDKLLTLSGVVSAEPTGVSGRVLVRDVPATWFRCQLSDFRGAWAGRADRSSRLCR